MSPPGRQPRVRLAVIAMVAVVSLWLPGGGRVDTDGLEEQSKEWQEKFEQAKRESERWREQTEAVMAKLDGMNKAVG